MTSGHLVTYFLKVPLSLSVLFIVVTKFWYFDLHGGPWHHLTLHDHIFSHLLLLFFAVWALLSYDHSISENYLVSLIALVPLLFLILTDSITRPSVVIAETEWLQSQILWRHNWWLSNWRHYGSSWLKPLGLKPRLLWIIFWWNF